MGLKAIKFEYEFNAIDCANCGMPFGITPDFEDRRRQDHRGFHCPNGHSNVYRGETEAEKLQKRLDAERRQTAMEREQRLKAERQLARVRKGVCPKCNRSFKALERHMATKHKGG
jgi:predicted GIY-YIG superfamily endonuclease